MLKHGVRLNAISKKTLLEICSKGAVLEVSLRQDQPDQLSPMQFDDQRYGQRAGGRITMPAELLSKLKEEVSEVDWKACRDADGQWRCPLCPNRHFRDKHRLITGHVAYHKAHPIPDAAHTCQGMVVQHLARKDHVSQNVCSLTGSGVLEQGGLLARSAAIIRRQVGVSNLKNSNDASAHVLLDEAGPRLSNDAGMGIRVTRDYFVTPKFLLLVMSFCDFRTQSKYLRVRDRIIEHFAARNSELCFLVPALNDVWNAIYRAGLALTAGYKKHCVDQLSFRVVSLDSSYKYTLSVVGQNRHGGQGGEKDPSALRCVHVMMAQQVPFSCKPGYAEGVPELAAFMKNSTTPSQRRETEIALFDTPYAWPLEKARRVFPNLKCVGGDPMHACIDLEKYVNAGCGLAKDFRKVILKFNTEPTPRFKAQRYFDIGVDTVETAPLGGTSPSLLKAAYNRLQQKAYRDKPYLSYKQYCADIQAIKHHHGNICSRRLRGSKGDKTVGDAMSKYMDMKRFFYYQNIIIYRAKSGESCQFGTTPNEAVMFQLKTYNANVLSSTRERCKLTLDLFSFGKVVSMHLKNLAPPGMIHSGPGSCHSHAMGLFRQGLANGSIHIPTTDALKQWTPATGTNIRKRPSMSASGPQRKRARCAQSD